jgi:Fic family protein
MEKQKRKYVKKEKIIEITPISQAQFNKDLLFLTSGKFKENKNERKQSKAP